MKEIILRNTADFAGLVLCHFLQWCFSIYVYKYACVHLSACLRIWEVDVSTSIQTPEPLHYFSFSSLPSCSSYFSWLPPGNPWQQWNPQTRCLAAVSTGNDGKETACSSQVFIFSFLSQCNSLTLCCLWEFFSLPDQQADFTCLFNFSVLLYLNQFDWILFFFFKGILLFPDLKATFPILCCFMCLPFWYSSPCFSKLLSTSLC